MRRKSIAGKVIGVMLVTVVMIATVLTGCGGGGGGSNTGGGGTGGGGTTELPTAATNLILAGYIKVLTLQWTPGTGATEFHVLMDADGTGQFQQVGSSVLASSSHATMTVAAHEVDWAKAQFAVDACNSAGCTRSAFVPAMPAMLASIGYFKASNTGSGGQYFGDSVALSGDGNTMAVGAPLESSNATGVNGGFTGSISHSGAVYVFANSGGAWSQQAYVKASNPEADDEFGLSVALSTNGNMLAVGAIGKNSAEGMTYVFTRNGNDWSQKTMLLPFYPTQACEFGDSVSLSGDGNTLVVGAPFDDTESTGVNNPVTGTATNAGAVYVFTNNGGTWSQQAYVKASNTDAGDEFGLSVSVSGDGKTFIVGAPGEASNGTSQSNNSDSAAGAAYVFTNSAGSWSQQAYVKSTDGSAGYEFGHSVALSGDGNTLAVGAWQYTNTFLGDIGTDVGSVEVYAHSGSDWNLKGGNAFLEAFSVQTGDLFGSSVALSTDGNTLAVGAYGEDSKATGINGDGTDNSDSGAGAVYVFEYSSANLSYTHLAYVKAANTGAQDVFGHAVAMSSDGKTLAVGAYEEDGAQAGISSGSDADKANAAINAGAVYLY